MRFYLAEDVLAGLRQGSMEARMEATLGALRAFHGSSDQVKRRVLATFDDGAVVLEQDGQAYRYRCEHIDGVLRAVRRDPIEVPVAREHPRLTEAEVIDATARERLTSLIATSAFTNWYEDHRHEIDARLWKSPSDQSKPIIESLREAAMVAADKAPEFSEEFNLAGFWYSKLSGPLSARDFGLIEYIKKITTFCRLHA